MFFLFVLDSAGAEVIFSLVTGKVLCLGFSRRITLMTHLMFWLLFSNAYPKPRAFQFPMLCQWACVQEVGREHIHDSWPELSTGIFHTVIHPAQCINWEPANLLASSFYLTVGVKLSWMSWIGQLVVSICIVHHFCFMSFMSPSPLPVSIIAIIIIIIISSSSFQLPKNSCLNPLVLPSFFLPPPEWRKTSRRMCDI